MTQQKLPPPEWYHLHKTITVRVGNLVVTLPGKPDVKVPKK